jgi:hypothetical protein
MTRLVMVLLIAMSGCVRSRTAHPSADEINPQRAKASFWMDHPSNAAITADDFDRLWNAAERAAKDHHFVLDRMDRRAGLITTRPLLSKQLFEVWRNDVPRLIDQAESTLATMRRTARFEISRSDSGQYELIAKVLVERLSMEEQRVTAVIDYQNTFNKPYRDEDREAQGKHYPPVYWYATGRDDALERELVNAIRKRVK